MHWTSISPAFYLGIDKLRMKFAEHPFHENNPLSKTTIGSDVWIGANVMIKAGVTIGNGAIIGMGSIVTKDIADYAIVCGNPAKPIRMRFDQNIAESLLQTRWWDLPDKDIKELAKFVPDVNRFVYEANMKRAGQ